MKEVSPEEHWRSISPETARSRPYTAKMTGVLIPTCFLHFPEHLWDGVEPGDEFVAKIRVVKDGLDKLPRAECWIRTPSQTRKSYIKETENQNG